jgi:hypothetical protein
LIARDELMMLRIAGQNRFIRNITRDRGHGIGVADLDSVSGKGHRKSLAAAKIGHTKKSGGRAALAMIRG